MSPMVSKMKCHDKNFTIKNLIKELRRLRFSTKIIGRKTNVILHFTKNSCCYLSKTQKTFYVFSIMPGRIFILIQIEYRSHGFHRFIKSNLQHLLNLRENPFVCSFALHEKTHVLKKILHKNFFDLLHLFILF